MPIDYARRLVGRHRTPDGNRHLGYTLAFVAGAVNAGGFLAVHQYTSHMTGIVSSMADNLALGSFSLLAPGISALAAFLAGAASCAMLVNYSRRHSLKSEYAVPLLVEAILLLCFGGLGDRFSHMMGFVPLTVMLLSFLMGLQNALVTKISRAEIRTTHVTGLITDVGIELGKLLYRNADSDREPRVFADRSRLTVLVLLALFFFGGGVAGAVGFSRVGYHATIPLAAVLVVLASVPAIDDLKEFADRRRSV